MTGSNGYNPNKLPGLHLVIKKMQALAFYVCEIYCRYITRFWSAEDKYNQQEQNTLPKIKLSASFLFIHKGGRQDKELQSKVTECIM